MKDPIGEELMAMKQELSVLGRTKVVSAFLTVR